METRPVLPSLNDEFPHRVERARRLLAERQWDALLLFTGPNLVYFTGMPCQRSGSRPFIYILPCVGEPILIVHEGRQYEAERFATVADVRTYQLLSRLPQQTVVEALYDRGVQAGRLGVEWGREMVMDLPFAEFAGLRDAVAAATFVDASPLLWQLRMIKSEAEVARIARACAITLEAYDQTFRAIQPGMTEAEIEERMLCQMLELGGSSPWALITSGAGNYDLVSKGGGPRPVAAGDMVWMDCGCAVDGYFSDFGRAAVLGGPTPAQEEAQAMVHQITAEAIGMMQPGTPVATIAGHVNRAVAEAGLPATSVISALAGRVGHGLGMAVTELPSINETDPATLAAGMIVTIEPGVATAYGTFHVEENVWITTEGPQTLSEGQWQLWVI